MRSIYSPPLIYFDFEINCTRVSINRQYVSSIIISISIYFYLFQNEISMETVVTGIQTMEVSQMTNQLFINNEFVESKSNDTMEVINPATGEAFDTITFATEEEVNEAIEKSKHAQLEWEKVPAPTRAEHVKLLIPLLEQNKDELAKLYVKEQGKTLAQAEGEIDKAVQFIDYMTSLSMRNKGEVLQNSVSHEMIQLIKSQLV